MVKVSKTQIGALEAEAEERFIKWIEDYLREKRPQYIEGLDPGTLRRRVKGAVARARHWGFTWQSSVVGFVVLMFSVGPDFDRHPAFKAALSRDMPDENDRIRGIYSTVSEEDVLEASERSEPAFWTTIEAAG